MNLHVCLSVHLFEHFYTRTDAQLETCFSGFKVDSAYLIEVKCSVLMVGGNRVVRWLALLPRSNNTKTCRLLCFLWFVFSVLCVIPILYYYDWDIVAFQCG